MASLVSQALIDDPAGLAFLADVLGTADLAAQPGRVFPREAWDQRRRADAAGFAIVRQDAPAEALEPVA